MISRDSGGHRNAMQNPSAEATDAVRRTSDAGMRVTVRDRHTSVGS